MTTTRFDRPSRTTTAVALLALLLGGGARAADDGSPQEPPAAPATAKAPAEEEKPSPKIPRRTEEVVVQAVRADVDTPITKTDVPREELEKKNYGQEMPAILSELPAMTYSSDTGLANGYTYVSMRGVPPTRINFTLDGAPLNEPEDSTLYFVDFADLAASTESLQVQRGVGTSAAGVASFVGSVNFASLDLKESAEGTARLSLGSFGAEGVSASYQTGRLGTSGLKAYVRGTWQSTDGFRDNSAIDQESVYAGLSHESEKGYFKLFGFVGREKSQSAYYAVEPWILDEDIRYNPLTPDEKDSFGQQFVEAQYTRFLSETSSLAAQLYVNDAGGWYRLKSSDGSELREYGLDWTNLGAAVTYKAALGPVGLTWGVHGSDFGSDRTRDVVGGERSWANRGYKSEASTFVKLARDAGPWHLYADAQLRWARFRYEGDVDLGSISWTFLNPKLGVRRDVGRDLSFYASVGATSREPGRGDLLYGEENASSWHDLHDVKPERVVAFELGSSFRAGPFAAQVNLYDMEFEDEIALTGEQSEVGLAIRRNADRSFRRGLEWDLSWRPVPQLAARFTGSWSWNRIRSWTQFYDVYDTGGEWVGTTSRTFADVEPVASPPFVGNLSVEGTPVPWLTLGAAARYVARSWLDATNAPGIDAPDWWRVDVSASIDLSRFVRAGRPRLRLSVDNLLDDRSIRPSGYSWLYATRDAAGTETLGGIPYLFPMATRNVTAVLDLGF
ncbi:MAG: TonB-dependent receptor plug domain-containing protein [Thermoanaerobaculia bacterium]